jgi:phosphohistidine phosphatase
VKTLVLMRHAKAVEKDDFVAEHDRALAPKGELDAALVGAFLRDHGLIPDRALCSTAARTHRTWQLVARALGREIPVELMREIYNAGSGGLYETIRRSGGSASVLALVGHNPGIHAVAVALCQSGDEAELAAMREKFPTGSLAVLRFPGDSWAEIVPGTATLVRFVRPKELKD